MKDVVKSFLGVLLIMGVGFALGLGYARRTDRNKPETPIVSKADTSSSVEPFEVERPKIKDSTVIHHIYIKVPVVPESAENVPEKAENVPEKAENVPEKAENVPDSALVDIPIERRVYEEDSLYRAVVSGPRIGKAGPSLDSLLIFSKTTTITVHEKSPAECRTYSWTLFPQAEVNYGGGALEIKAGIGVDMAINENGRWRFIPEFGYRTLQIDDRMLKGCYVGGKIKYNLIQVK